MHSSGILVIGSMLAESDMSKNLKDRALATQSKTILINKKKFQLEKEIVKKCTCIAIVEMVSKKRAFPF